MATAGRVPQRGERRERAERLAEQICASQRGLLLAIARHNSACVADAEESLQEAFILFLDRFDPDGAAPPLAWLTLTLKRQCWDRYHRERILQREGAALSPVVPRGTGPQSVADHRRRPDELAELHDAVRRVRAELATLKPDERRALGLLALGYSYREIGEITGWTRTKINRCVAEGRAVLREARRRDEGGEE